MTQCHWVKIKETLLVFLHISYDMTFERRRKKSLCCCYGRASCYMQHMFYFAIFWWVFTLALSLALPRKVFFFIFFDIFLWMTFFHKLYLLKKFEWIYNKQAIKGPDCHTFKPYISNHGKIMIILHRFCPSMDSILHLIIQFYWRQVNFLCQRTHYASKNEQKKLDVHKIEHSLPIRNLAFDFSIMLIWCYIYCYKFTIHWLWCFIVYIIVRQWILFFYCQM